MSRDGDRVLFHNLPEWMLHILHENAKTECMQKQRILRDNVREAVSSETSTDGPLTTRPSDVPSRPLLQRWEQEQ